MTNEVLAFVPGRKFPSISITGNKCWLMCAYCMGRFLKGMDHILTPKQLYDLARYYARNGAYGLLISGGFTREGYLPVEPYLSVIREIKRDFDLVINLHAGLVPDYLVEKLRNAGIDVIDYEFLYDPVVIRDIKHLEKNVSEYLRVYEILLREGPPYIAPHIPLGIKYGMIGWEKEAMDLLVELDPYIIVFLVFIPTKGTPMYRYDPPPIKDVLDIISYARRRYHGEISMGCMRPVQFKYRLDEALIDKKLVNRLVNPKPALIRKYRLRVINSCCSVPREILAEKGLI